LRKPFYFNIEGLPIYGYFDRGLVEVADLDGIPMVANLDS
jgi:hypothetical protein